MELADIIALRPEPCAGLLLELTRRCPLDCAHCSSDSTMAGLAPDDGHLLRFVGSFGPQDRPEVTLMTGGEPLLHPALVARIAEIARPAGTRSMVLTGAYFAAHGRYPGSVRRAVRSIDHLSVSIDIHHERHIPREDVFRLLRHVLDDGVRASLHVTGNGPDDPYLADLIADVQGAFGDSMPMLVTTVRAIGRAASWAAARPAADGEISPCAMAAWPVVAHDGLVASCCNQETLTRRPAPRHLVLGDIATDDWPAIRRRALASPELRMIRSAGPAYLMARLSEDGPGSLAGRSYCQSCHHISDSPAVMSMVQALGASPAGEMLDRHAARVQREAGPVALLRRHACIQYAHLVTAGYPAAAVAQAGET